MEYLLAIILPPVAVAMYRGIGLAIVATLLLFAYWIPGAIFALIIVADAKARERNKRVVDAIRGDKPIAKPLRKSPQIDPRGMRELHLTPLNEDGTPVDSGEPYDPAEDWLRDIKPDR